MIKFIHLNSLKYRFAYIIDNNLCVKELKKIRDMEGNRLTSYSLLFLLQKKWKNKLPSWEYGWGISPANV